MKKILISVVTFLIIAPTVCFGAAITCTQVPLRLGNPAPIIITMECTGGTDDTTISFNTENNALVLGKKLMAVSAFVTAGGDQPDAADVTVNCRGLDLLGGKGANLIPATDITNETLPYNTFNGLYRFKNITGDVTVGIANEGTSGFDATIVLEFE
jgi:hypothetical protein